MTLTPCPATPNRGHRLIRKAQLSDVPAMAAALGGHMAPAQRNAFEDKLNRYARKPDRNLYVAFAEDRIVGFGCVIDQSPAPSNRPFSSDPLFNRYAAITGLMVMPPYRCQGIGKALVQHLEAWARKRHRHGIWLITHRMAKWYRKHFNYSEMGKTCVKSVEKTVMIRHFR